MRNASDFSRQQQISNIEQIINRNNNNQSSKMAAAKCDDRDCFVHRVTALPIVSASVNQVLLFISSLSCNLTFIYFCIGVRRVQCRKRIQSNVGTHVWFHRRHRLIHNRQDRTSVRQVHVRLRCVVVVESFITLI
jgi:hypothetical protein